MTPLVRLWIWISAFASLAGWTLSALGQLNRAGYVAAFVVFAIFIFVRRKDLGVAPEKHFSRAKKFLRRFRRPLPFFFAALAVLIFISGVIHAPDNYTGVTYRIPRVLQWLSHDGWFWIHTPNYRMNDRACGIEWLSAPFLLFTNSTRGLFLLNFIPFLLMPGLIFSVLTRLGVRMRVARQWMWLLPTGYNFLLQAGSIANDTFPTIYALAAIDFALRAGKSKQFSDAAHSILAAALMTGAKGTNLPLLLPWAIVIFSSHKLFSKKAMAVTAIILLAAAVSFLPTAILNSRNCGDWSGAALEPAVLTVKNPVVGVSGNVFQLLLGNFAPPLFPPAGWWNGHAPQFMPSALVAVSKHFDDGFFWLGELPTEDWSGIGLGLSALLVISIFANFFARKNSSPRNPSCASHTFILVAPWLSLLVYCAKSGMTAPGRLISPYYPLLLPLLLVGAAQSQIIRRCWWKILVGVHLIFALAILVLSPDRPLWPAKTILSRLAAQNPDSHLISRALNVYTTYSRRSDSLADVRKLLPEDAKTIGFVAGADDADISFWLPLGSRRVEHFLLDDSPDETRKRCAESNINYLVIGDYNLKSHGLTIDDWLQKNGAELVATTNATLKVSEGSQSWFVVRLKLKPAP